MSNLYSGTKNRRVALWAKARATSAKLDFYRDGGDSLQGRYLAYRLHPLSVAELGIETNADLDALLRLGGFPEPFFGGSEREARRWSQAYRTLIKAQLTTRRRRVSAWRPC